VIESPTQTIRCACSGCGGEAGSEAVLPLLPKGNEPAMSDNNKRTSTP